MIHVGVVLTSSPKRKSSVAVWDGERVKTITTFFTNDEILLFVQEHKPGVIAIASPLNLPTGLCCLEASCDCRQSSSKKGTLAEQELLGMRIGIFPTIKGSIIRDQIYRGIALKGELEKLGWKVIEVNSTTNKVLLFDEGEMPKKKASGHASFLAEQLAILVQGSEPYIANLQKDVGGCEALIGAHVAFLYAKKETDALGDSEEGLIIVPPLPR